MSTVLPPKSPSETIIGSTNVTSSHISYKDNDWDQDVNYSGLMFTTVAATDDHSPFCDASICLDHILQQAEGKINPL